MFTTLVEMKQSLRLSGVPDNPTLFDAARMLDDALLGARVEFYRRLAITRVNELVGYSHADEPTNQPQVYRACAELLEVKLVLLKLLPRIRQFLLDSTGSSEDAFQREGLLRDMSGDALTARILELRAEIDSDFAFLEGDTELGDETINATCFEPDETPPRPGESLRQFANVEYDEAGRIFLRELSL